MTKQKNTKARSQAMQERAMEIVEIKPMSEQAEALIAEMQDQLSGPTKVSRLTALEVLQESNALIGVDIGGIVNETEAIQTLMSEFGCTRKTARNHVSRAARRKRHPDYRPPQWGNPDVNEWRRQ